MKIVLLVEDDDQLNKALVQILERAGYRVVSALDGDAALATLKLIVVQLLITDLFLPGKDGFQLIDACRKMRPALPILAISGGGTVATPSDMLSDARRVGAAATLEKPFSNSELIDAVARLIGPPSSAAQLPGFQTA